MDAKKTNAIDQHIGRKIRFRRAELKLSQEALAATLGVTFQQVQKYERGANRVSAGRLFQIADALRTTIPWLYEGCEVVSRAALRGAAEDDSKFNGIFDPEAMDLVIAFQSISDAALRKSILQMVKTQAASTIEPKKK